MKVYDVDGRAYPCHLFFESVCGKEKAEKAKEFDFSSPDTYVSETCKYCELYTLCPTCCGSNYISRGKVSERDMGLCVLNKIRFYENARYEYERIIHSHTDISTLSDAEKHKRYKILEGLKKILPFLNTFDVENCVSGAVRF